MILGGGPNRIGQGIESTTAVSTPLGPQEAGLRDHHVNCNPETVSTDYDTSDKLYLSR